MIIKRSVFSGKRKEESAGHARGGTGRGGRSEQFGDGSYASALTRPTYRRRGGGPNSRGRDHSRRSW